MRILLYSMLLNQYGITYLDCITNSEGNLIVYGYNKSTQQYSFWTVIGLFKLRLMEVCESRTKAMFQYKILSRGV